VVAPSAPASLTGSTVELLDPLSDPLLDAPVVKSGDAPRGAAAWPCLACGASVALEHDACTQCGTPFLAGADPVAAVEVPLVGPIRPLAVSKGARAWVMIGGGLAVCVVLVIVLSLVGLLL
jgi:hypothetical protein